MKPLSLKLRGAIGIYDGLGLDEISIDFTKYEAGLIALVGPNGAGKTTILENLHPYRQLASREGALANHFRLRDSARVLSFTVAGIVYQSVIAIDSHTGKQEAYLYRDGAPLNDGKTTTYDIEVEKLFGTADLFFRSIFTAQNSRSITSLTAGKRKELFIELLGLQRYDLYADYAKRKADESDSELQGKRGKIQQIDSQIACRDAVLSALTVSEGDLALLVASISVAEQEAEVARKTVSKLELAIAENESYKKLLDKARIELSEIETDRTDNLTQAMRELKQITDKQTPIKAEIERKKEIVSHADTINGAVASLVTLRTQEKELSASRERLLVVQQEETIAILAYQKEKSEYDMTVANQRRKVMDYEGQRDRLLDQRESKLGGLKEKRKGAERSSELTEKVPCHAVAGLPEQCMLLAGAIESRNAIPLIDADIQRLESDEWREVIGISAIEKEIAALENVLSDLRNHPPVNGIDFSAKKAAVGYDIERHASIREKIAQLEGKKWEELQRELEIAQSQITEKELALTSLAEQFEALKVRTDARTAELDVKISEKQQEVDGISASMSDTVMEKYEAANRALEALLFEANDRRNRQISLASEVATNRANLERLDNLASDKETLDGQIQVLNWTIEHWRLLQRACGKDGIPALELDAAGPAVSQIANELLTSTFGSRFQIAFETTRLTKDKKKQVETFEIRVYGEEGEKNIEDLSGGQRVWIEKSIQEAIAIYLSEKSGKEYLTSYADESDGALDPDNKQHFLEMLRASFKLGRRHFTFLITQTPEIWQQVQQRIVLHPDSSSVERVY